MDFMKGGSEHIRKIIATAIANGTRRASVNGNWEMDSAVRIPSDFQLILDDCHLKMADNTFDNMFINDHYGTEEGKTLAGTDRNISIIGRGHPILDGGTYNGLSEKTARKNGMPPIYKNNILLFTNVDGFEVRNLSVHNMRYWALNFIYCANGEITDIHFEADDTCVDGNGNIYHGFSDINYYDMLRKQCDGVDIRQGCHHILIENISGFTGDDTVALTCLSGKTEQEHAVAGLSSEIAYIKIKNVVSETLASNVRLLCQTNAEAFPSRMHDIVVDGVEDISHTTDHLVNHGHYGVQVNDCRMYGSRHATADEMYNIVIRNIRSRAYYAVSIAGIKPKKFVCENVIAFDGAGYMEDLTL